MAKSLKRERSSVNVLLGWFAGIVAMKQGGLTQYYDLGDLALGRCMFDVTARRVPYNTGGAREKLG